MKIAFLTEFFHPHIGGCERRFREIGVRLARRGHEVHVLTVLYDSCLPKEDLVNGIIVHRYAYSKNYTSRVGYRSINGVLKYSFATFKRLIGENFDVYYFNEWPMLHALFARPVAFPLVQEWCEVWDKNLGVAVLQRLMKRFGDHHVAVSEFTRQRMSTFLKIDPRKVVVIPNGVDYAKFHGPSSNKAWGRFVYVGRLMPHKHVELLINSFHKVKKNIPEAELHIIGSGPSLPSIKCRASRVKDCYVHGALHEDQMIKLLKSCWLLVLPSEREGSGIVVLEAMAAGMPFITVNYPDNAGKEIANFKCGLVVNPCEDSIAEAMIRVLKDDESWKEMSANASSYAKRFDWDIVTDRMEDFLQMVIKDGKE